MVSFIIFDKLASLTILVFLRFLRRIQTFELCSCTKRLFLTFQGNLLPRNSTFPSGIKGVADYVHSKGLKLGIYSDSG